MQIHERIKNERIKANLSEEDMAAKLEIPRATYQYWEKKTPSIDKIKAVARVLNKPDDYFFITYDEKIKTDQIISVVSEPSEEYKKNDSKINEKEALYDALLEEKERVIKKAEEFAKKMEAHYDDAKHEKAQLLNIINNALKEISKNLSDTAANLAHNRQDLALLKDQTYIVSSQLEHLRVASDLGMPGEKKSPQSFVKKDTTSSAQQHVSGKKNKDH